jgi:hypothetical protein
MHWKAEEWGFAGESFDEDAADLFVEKYSYNS